MYNFHDETQRRSPQQMGYENSVGSASTRGSLIALLVVVVLLGGLVALSSFNTGTITEENGATAPAATDGQATNPQAGTGIVVE